MKALAIFLMLLCVLPKTVICARILCVFPIPSKSHLVVFTALTKELANRGHELVVVSPFPVENPPVNYTDIDIMPGMKELYDQLVGADLYELSHMSNFFIPFMMWEDGITFSQITFDDPAVKKLINDKIGFDLVIVEDFMMESLFAFADYFKAPLVLMSSFGGHHCTFSGFGNPLELSHTPDNMLQFTDTMTFVERLENVLFTTFWKLGDLLYYLPHQEALRKEYFGDKTRSVWDLRYSASLGLLNSHFSTNYPRALLPSIVEVGGMQIKQSMKQLPADIQQFLDEATEGAIYFSMGSNLRSDAMASEKRDAIISAFAELPQRVLMKWESASLPYAAPKNIKLGKWLPQQEILGHPNIRLFITHGGLLSTHEAAYHGVPLIGIPIFGDQMMNMLRVQRERSGILIELNNVTKSSILWAVNKVLHEDPRIQEEANRRSLIFRDQPQTPLERAVFWVEHVLRHKGAPHLRSGALNLQWYQLLLIDVLVVAVVTICTLCFLIHCTLKLVCARKIVTSHSKKEN